jgi:hypothetical protein
MKIILSLVELIFIPINSQTLQTFKSSQNSELYLNFEIYCCKEDPINVMNFSIKFSKYSFF